MEKGDNKSLKFGRYYILFWCLFSWHLCWVFEGSYHPLMHLFHHALWPPKLHLFNIYHLQKDGKPSFTLNDLFFDFDSYTIKNSFEQYLLLLVDQINQNKEIEVEINGHTDNKGKEEYNQALSLKELMRLNYFWNQM